MKTAVNWEKFPLAQFVELINGYAFPSEGFTDGEGTPLIRIRDLECQVTEVKYRGKYNDRYLVKKRDLLIGMDGDFLAVKWKGSDALLNQRVCKLITKDPTTLAQDFLFYRIIGEILRINRITAATTVKHLSSKDVLGIEIELPPAPEQAKIAEILSTVDRAIEQTEALIAKQQRIKTGLMQNLLTRGIDEHGTLRSEETHKFKDSPLGRIPVEWEIKPAFELCDSVIDCKNRTPPPASEGHPVIRTPNVRNGEFVYCDLNYTDSISYEIWIARGRPRAGDVVITREAPFGEACLIPNDLYEPCLGQRMMMYQPNLTKLRPDYLVFAIYSEALQEKLLELAGGSTVGHIRVGDIRKLPIPHPISIEEQKTISELLTIAAESIKKLELQGQKLLSLKTAIMQDLLTGKKRVIALLTDTGKVNL